MDKKEKSINKIYKKERAIILILSAVMLTVLYYSSLQLGVETHLFLK